MTDKEKKVVFILVAIMVIILIVVICVKSFGNDEKEGENTVASQQTTTNSNNTTNVQNEEKYVTQLNDGTKLNNSEELKDVKKYKTVEISNIQVTSNNGNSTILADVKNIGNTVFEKEVVKLTLYGENDEVIAELSAVIPDIQVGKTEQLNTMVTADIANVKDFKVEQK